MEFNQILPQNFFNLFQSKHRDIYIESLIKIYDRYETGSILGMPKEDARDIVEQILEERHVGLNDFEEEDTGDEIPSYRELANYCIRRLEATGWITIDITNDYLEVLNFTDNAISITLALEEIKRAADYSLFADNFTLDSNEQAFRGYIFTIYSLLNSKTYDYGLLLNQVYKNTINFVREIRKVDHKLKEFIHLIDEKENLKDLVELLAQYKDEIMDRAYFKLKTFDNINKYKLDIVRKLEAMQEDPDVMSIISNDYLFLASNDVNMARFIANKQINDCIDIYNSLEGIMDEIDKKNRDYITQTLSKVKYLINDSVDVASELNTIITHYASKVKKGQSESGFQEIRKLFELNVDKTLSIQSLSVPRGTYKKTEVNKLSKETLNFTGMTESFFQVFRAAYKEEDIKKLLDESIEPGDEKDMTYFFPYDSTRKEVIKLLYIVVFIAGMDNYELIDTDEYIETKNYIVKDFRIRRRIA